jgi:Fibronectin type III-like domain
MPRVPHCLGHAQQFIIIGKSTRNKRTVAGKMFEQPSTRNAHRACIHRLAHQTGHLRDIVRRCRFVVDRAVARHEYTSFTYDKPVLDRSQINGSGTATVTVKVANVGQRTGAEVVQMYVHPKVSSVVQPVMRLAGFERVELVPG